MVNKNAGQHFRDMKKYNADNGTNLSYKEWKEKVNYQPKPKFIAKNPRKKPNVQLVEGQATASGESKSDLDTEKGGSQ